MTDPELPDVTPAMRLAVARDRCNRVGHDFRVMGERMSTLAPQFVECSNCFSTWRIHPDDLNANWGTERR